MFLPCECPCIGDVSLPCLTTRGLSWTQTFCTLLFVWHLACEVLSVLPVPFYVALNRVRTVGAYRSRPRPWEFDHKKSLNHPQQQDTQAVGEWRCEWMITVLQGESRDFFCRKDRVGTYRKQLRFQNPLHTSVPFPQMIWSIWTCIPSRSWFINPNLTMQLGSIAKII